MSRASRPSRGARVPDDDALRRITTRAVAEIVPHQEFLDGLRSGRPLRLKIGLDPTKPVIHLGWTVPLRKLRQLQDLGHTVVIIIGDWTARIGDPSGASQTRPMLTAEQVHANSQAILPQFYKVLDERRTEIRRQSEWYDKFDLTEVVRLAARFTVAQVLQRDDFAQRYADHRPIGIHELVYPLLQGYDSFAIEADVEFGGTDQKFNNLVGRELQRMLGQKAGPAGEGQAVFLVPLLVGLDGTQKMSQSLGNYIGIDDPPHDMYGKLMSIPDSLTMDYFQLLTDVPDDELASIRSAVEAGGAPAMDHKMRLARDIVTQFHSEQDAQEAEDEFARTFRKREAPQESVGVPALELPLREMAKALSSGKWMRLSMMGEKEPRGKVMFEAVDVRVYASEVEPPRAAAGIIASCGELLKRGEGVVLDLADVMSTKLELSRMEIRRLLSQGAVEVDGERVEGLFAFLRDGSIIRVGKHRFLRIVEADKRPQEQSE